MMTPEHYGLLKMPTAESIGELVREAREYDERVRLADQWKRHRVTAWRDDAWASAVVRLIAWLFA